MAPSTDDHGSNVPTLSQGVHRQPTMGLLSAINLLLACIIGSGIFISAKVVLEYSGSYGLSIVVWIGCGLLCTMVKKKNFRKTKKLVLFREVYVMLNLGVHMYHQVVIIHIFEWHLVIFQVFFVFGLKLFYLDQ
jgi:hypothetical protein